MKSKKSDENQNLASHDHLIDAPMEAAEEPEHLKDVVFNFLMPDGMRDDLDILPAEHVALHVLDLPIRSARQRREAVPFALEEAVGATLEHVHFPVFETFADGRLLVAVIDTDLMERRVLPASDRAIVAEQMLVPPPAPNADGGRTWRTIREGDRILVRVSDGTGFAAHAKSLPILWRAAGKPFVEAYGAPLPDIVTSSAQPNGLAPSFKSLDRYDLRQGAYQRSRGLARPLRWLAASFTLGLFIHLGLIAADVRAQREIAERLQEAASLALDTRIPDASADDPPALLIRQIASVSAAQRSSNFLPLMNDVSQAWLSEDVSVQLRQLNWSDNGLRLVVESPDLEALQRAEASLAAGGLQVSTGSATADAGSARAELTVRP